MLKNYLFMLVSLAYIAFSVWRIKKEAMTPRAWVFMVMFSLFLVFLIVLTIMGEPIDSISSSL